MCLYIVLYARINTISYLIFHILSILRTLVRPPMLSVSCIWPRLKGIWRMFLPTNKPFHSNASAVELGALLRQRTAILMDKDAGLSNLQNLFWIYSRMLRAMQMYVHFNCLSCYFLLYHYLLNHFYFDVNIFFPVERLGCGFSLRISHPGKPSSEAKAPHIPCSWKN